MSYLYISIILCIAILVSIMVGMVFFKDHSDPLNGLIAVTLLWIIPCILALLLAMDISWRML